MPKLTFLPQGRIIEIPEGMDVLSAALEHGIAIDHACGGHCACSTCHIYVEEGQENASPSTEEEQDQLDMAKALRLNSRLACQTKVRGDLKVRIP